MRSILVLADHGPLNKTRLETALSLARVHGGHLTVLIDTPVGRYMASDAVGSSYLVADAVRDAIARDDAFAGEMAEHLAREDVPFDVVRGEEEPVDALSQAARLADVVVLSRGLGLAGQVALSTSTPVLVVPDERIVTMPPERVCVAWDGGEEAAGAIRAAAPLLALCNEVHVLQVQEKDGGLPSRDALLYLSRHDVTAELHELPRAGSVEQALASAVNHLGAELLVMGAFGHSRLREFLFGGVTRHFLADKAGPALLLAH